MLSFRQERDDLIPTGDDLFVSVYQDLRDGIHHPPCPTLRTCLSTVSFDLSFSLPPPTACNPPSRFRRRPPPPRHPETEIDNINHPPVLHR